METKQNPKQAFEDNIIRDIAVAQDRGRKGGLARTEKKRIANQLKALKSKKCKNCNLPCPFKTQMLEEDIDSTCKIPPSIKGLLTLRTKEDFMEQAQKLLMMFGVKAGSDEKKLKEAFYMILNLKKEFEPETIQVEQKSINIDINLEEFNKLYDLHERANAIKHSNAELDSEDRKD